ncbi:hypothetical protein GCM10007084_05410 [Parabacteroides faecis]|nr:hypothetical protein GCM10007084_05410 [Parabacteroides faecis]
MPSVLTDGLVNALSIWTLVPFKQFQKNVAEANKEKQLVNRQLKLTANEPVRAVREPPLPTTLHSILIRTVNCHLSTVNFKEVFDE